MGQGRAPLDTVATLSAPQRELVLRLGEQASSIAGVVAVVLGGSHARGRARPGSDIDLGLLYREHAPFAIDAIRALARRVNDTPEPVVSGFQEWGRWVNGGSWLTIGGQRVDFLYRSIDQLERWVAAAEAGHYEQDYGQQPPFGFFSDTYLAELETAVPLFDPEQVLARLKQRVQTYPPALRLKLAHDGLKSAQFALYMARGAAASGDASLTAACATRAQSYLLQALFAFNRRYRVNDKTALAEITSAEHVPADLAPRCQAIFAHLGNEPEALRASVAALTSLAQEVVQLGERAFADQGAAPAWFGGLDMATI
jgi:hypothetical protein